MFQQQLFHGSAMVIELLNNSKHFAPVLEMGCKKVDMDNEINQWNIR